MGVCNSLHILWCVHQFALCQIRNHRQEQTNLDIAHQSKRPLLPLVIATTTDYGSVQIYLLSNHTVYILFYMG